MRIDDRGSMKNHILFIYTHTHDAHIMRHNRLWFVSGIHTAPETARPVTEVRKAAFLMDITVDIVVENEVRYALFQT